MQAVNDYVIVDIVKEGPKKVGGLILTDETDETNRYKKSKVISTGNDVAVVSKGDTIYYDAIAGHDIAYNDVLYLVIRSRDIVIVE
jgi:co-chaperonin GroES (HSP10)